MVLEQELLLEHVLLDQLLLLLWLQLLELLALGKERKINGGVVLKETKVLADAGVGGSGGGGVGGHDVVLLEKGLQKGGGFRVEKDAGTGGGSRRGGGRGWDRGLVGSGDSRVEGAGGSVHGGEQQQCVARVATMWRERVSLVTGWERRKE
ncbi:hypothetical protein B0O80DRAFT_463842 [Mortierella sp. GBAus27b]|nr:hypothetical protein B0O80DRAFT_463842 [Mortierella sp. GBAus27b]